MKSRREKKMLGRKEREGKKRGGEKVAKRIERKERRGKRRYEKEEKAEKI